jgi:hypothetical protein
VKSDSGVPQVQSASTSFAIFTRLCAAVLDIACELHMSRVIPILFALHFGMFIISSHAEPVERKEGEVAPLGALKYISPFKCSG